MKNEEPLVWRSHNTAIRIASLHTSRFTFFPSPSGEPEGGLSFKRVPIFLWRFACGFLEHSSEIRVIEEAQGSCHFLHKHILGN